MSRKFLIGQLGCFGDCLFATPLAKQIKNDYPDSHVTWAVAGKYKSILALNPYVDSIWEISVSDNNYSGESWTKFETEALQRKSDGEFDEIIFSQIPPLNWIKYTGTIRNTILSTYGKPITVPIEPTIKLSENEIENVKLFSEKYNLGDFKNVILFECAPGSGQSTVNTDFAIIVAREILKKRNDVCFILTTPKKLEIQSSHIIDASELTFRENAELTKYCTLLIGTGSGISWLSTSDWAKNIPMLQLLDSTISIYAGIHFDLESNEKDVSRVLEMIEFDETKVVDCINSLIEIGPEKSKPLFHQRYQPTYFNLKSTFGGLLYTDVSLRELKFFIKNFVEKNEQAGNKISLKYIYLIFQAYNVKNVIPLKMKIIFYLKKILKPILWKKSL